MNISTGKLIVLGIMIAGIPSPAYAYIDPGILGTLFQAAYALFFGVIAAWIFKPWYYIKSFFNRPDRDSAEAGKSATEKAAK